jgi:hypothetical protein
MDDTACTGVILPNLTPRAGIQESEGYFFFDRDATETLLLMKRNVSTANA